MCSADDPGNAWSIDALRRLEQVAPRGLKGCVGERASEEAAEAPDVGSKWLLELLLMTPLGPPAEYAWANIGFGGYMELEEAAAGALRKKASKSGGVLGRVGGAERKNASKSGGWDGCVEGRGGGAVPMYCNARWGPDSLVTSPGG